MRVEIDEIFLRQRAIIVACCTIQPITLDAKP
jgi:hypothetical protein